MDTIRSYIDNMFLGYPKNEAMNHAKEELFSMMEDKYYELKNEGKTENEAIGIVISEFGNLNEVSEALGISENTLQEKSEMIQMSDQEAQEYLSDVKRYLPKVSLGIAIVISSVSVLMFMLGAYALDYLQLNEDRVAMIALSIMFIVAALGVFLIVSNFMQLSQYDFLDKEIINLDYQTTQKVKTYKAQVSTRFKKSLSLSIVMYILSVIPLFLSIALFGEENEGPILIAVGLLILIVAIATYNLLIPYGPHNAVNKLLQVDE